MLPAAAVVSTISALWPSGSPDAEVRVKHVAAMHLLACPQHKDTTSAVASAVKQRLNATVSGLGISKKFRQIFLDDPWFQVLDPHADETCIVLCNVSQLAAVGHHSVQQTFTVTSPAETPNPTGAQPPLLGAGGVAAAIDTVWLPGGQSPAEAKICNAAARNLSGMPGRQSLSSPLAAAVAKKVGTTKKLGISKSFAQVLRDDGCFQFRPGPTSNEAAVLLDVSQLLLRAKQQQQQQKQQVQLPAPPLPPPRLWLAAAQQQRVAFGVSAAQLLQHVSSRRWVSTNRQLDVAKTALAVHLVKRANPSVANGPAAASAGASAAAEQVPASYEILAAQAGEVMLKALAKEYPGQDRPWPNKSLPEAFVGDPYFSTFMSAPSVRAVRLDITKLLHDIRIAAGTNASFQPSASSASSARAAAASLEAAAAALMPPTSPGPRQAAEQQQQQVQMQRQPGTPAAAVRVVPRPRQEAKEQQPHPAKGAQQQQQQQQHQPVGLMPLTFMPLLESLQGLTAVSNIDCSLAEVVGLTEQHWGSQQQQHLLQDVLQHVQAAGLAALDIAVVSGAVSSGSSQQLALLLLLVPSASKPQKSRSWDATIYAVELPEQQQAAQEVLQRFQQVLEDRRVVKVMHDARAAARCLLQQFGIGLAGVLDTQLLAGLASLAGASSASGANSSSSSSSSQGWSLGLQRQSLASLSQCFEIPQPAGTGSLAILHSNPRQWFARPLPRQHMEAAADASVRYLLPLACSLVQQVPQALLNLCKLQLLLAQHGAAALQLQPQLLPGYRPLLRGCSSSNSMLSISSSDSADSIGAAWPSSSAVAAASSSSSSSSAAAAGYGVLPGLQEVPGLTQLTFELQVTHDSSGGWFRPQYVVYLAAQDHDGTDNQAATLSATATSAATGQGISSNSSSWVLAEVSDDTALLGAEGTVVSGSSRCASTSANASAHADAGGDWDEAVQSIAELLPERICEDLRPFMTSSPGRPQLVEVTADKNKPVTLRFANRTSQQLGYSININSALDRLADAKWQHHHQHQEQQPHPAHECPANADAQPLAFRSLSSITAAGSGSGELDNPVLAAATNNCLDAARPGSSSGSSEAGKGAAVAGEIFSGVSSALADKDRSNSTDGRQQSGVKWGGVLGLLKSAAGHKSSSNMQAEGSLDGSEPTGSSLLDDQTADNVLCVAAASSGGAVTPAVTTTAEGAAGGSRRYDHMFGSDNRMGVPGTLHRISAMRNKQGVIYGLTFRIGRHVPGVALLLADLLSDMKASLDPDSGANRPRSLLVLGRPGVGKTTTLRDIARLLSNPPAAGGLGLAVVIVDTSNEIAGDAEEGHPCVGAARRMMVRDRSQQADVLVQAVQNHNPDVVIVDEIGTREEVAAARTIAQRGVLLVGTAHGNSLRDLLANPDLRALVGGVQAVTLGDAEAKATNRGNKTRFERAGAATFVSLLELRKKNEWCLHMNVEESVDIMLRSPEAQAAASGGSMAMQDCLSSSINGSGVSSRHDGSTQWHPPNTQIRSRDASGRLLVQFETAAAAKQTLAAAQSVAELAGGNKFLPGGSTAAAQAFSGGWMVDLLHAAVHRSINLSSGG